MKDKTAPFSDGKTDGQWFSLWLLIGFAVAVRLVLAMSLGLSVDESYSTAVSREWSLSYYDHPPLHLWLIHACVRLFGTEAMWVVRLPFIVLGAASSYLLYQLARRSFGAQAAWWTLVAFSVAPFFSMGSSSWALPDGPMIFCALLMTLFFRRALDDDRFYHWSVCGLAAGAGLLSKYLMVFPLLGCLVFLLSTAPRRLRSWRPWWALLCALVVFSPVLIWNEQHQWASFAFQGGRARFSGWHVGQALALFLAGALYLGPFNAYLAVRQLRHSSKPASDREGWWFVCLSLPALLVFTGLGLTAHLLPHWVLIGWLFALPLVGRWAAQSALQTPAALATWLKGSVLVFTVLIGLAVSDAVWGLYDGVLPHFPQNDPLTEELNWAELPGALQAQGLLQPNTVLVVQSFVDAGKVDYAMGGAWPVLCLCDDPHHYGIVRPPSHYLGARALVIANARRQDWWIRAMPYFSSLTQAQTIDIHRGGRVAIRLNVAVGDALRATPQAAVSLP